MNEEFDKEVCDLKMCSLKDILINHESKIESHEARITSLEAYNIEAKISNEALQKQQFELKALTLELDKNTNLRMEKQFDKIILAQEKNEIKNDKKFSDMANTQTQILTKIIEGQNIKSSGKIEITKAKIALFGTSIAGIISIVMFLLEKFVG
jgi:hypothetical protein